MTMKVLTAVVLVVISSTPVRSFQNFAAIQQSQQRRKEITTSLYFFGGNGGGPPSIPTSSADRDRQAIDSVKAAINKPKNPSIPLIECEFPPLEALNKLGDGSLRSAKLVDDVRLLCV